MKNHNHDTAVIWIVWAVKNSIALLIWAGMAVYFHAWWMALFAIFFLSSFETSKESSDTKKYHYTCDGCGRHSPNGADLDEAEQNRLQARWIRKKSPDGVWKDFCPDCSREAPPIFPLRWDERKE